MLSGGESLKIPLACGFRRSTEEKCPSEGRRSGSPLQDVTGAHTSPLSAVVPAGQAHGRPGTPAAVVGAHLVTRAVLQRWDTQIHHHRSCSFPLTRATVFCGLNETLEVERQNGHSSVIVRINLCRVQPKIPDRLPQVSPFWRLSRRMVCMLDLKSCFQWRFLV